MTSVAANDMAGLEAGRDYRVRPLRVVLVTQFAESHLLQDTLPELERRGIEIVNRFEPKHVSNVDLRYLRETKGVELVLLMHEVAGHSDTGAVASAARAAELPLHYLSRKKASWAGVLPPPLDEAPPSDRAVEDSSPSSVESAPVLTRSRAMRRFFSRGAVSPEIAAIADGYAPLADATHDEEIERRRRVMRWAEETGFRPKEARLRDAVQYMLLVFEGCEERHGREARDEHIVEALRQCRSEGVFPKLLNVRGDELEKRVLSLIENETESARLDDEDGNDDRPAPSSASVMEDEMESSEPSVLTKGERMAEAIAGKDDPPPIGRPAGPITPGAMESITVAGEVERLQRRVDQLEQREEAIGAFKTLVRLGYLTPAEVAERLLGLRSS